MWNHLTKLWGTGLCDRPHQVSNELFSLLVTCTHHNNVAGPVLDGAKEAEDDDDDVEEVGKDGGPLVTQEVKDLSFQSQHLKGGTKKEKGYEVHTFWMKVLLRP